MLKDLYNKHNFNIFNRLDFDAVCAPDFYASTIQESMVEGTQLGAVRGASNIISNMFLKSDQRRLTGLVFRETVFYTNYFLFNLYKIQQVDSGQEIYSIFLQAAKETVMLAGTRVAFVCTEIILKYAAATVQKCEWQRTRKLLDRAYELIDELMQYREVIAQDTKEQQQKMSGPR